MSAKHTPFFRHDNTEGYSATDLQWLNNRFNKLIADYDCESDRFEDDVKNIGVERKGFLSWDSLEKIYFALVEFNPKDPSELGSEGTLEMVGPDKIQPWGINIFNTSTRL